MLSIDELLPKLPQDIVPDIIKLLSEKEKIIKDKDNHIKSLEYKIDLLLRERYCTRSDRLPLDTLKNPQGSLFDEAEELNAENESQINQDQITIVASHERQKGGRKPLPKDLLRIQHVYDLDDSEKYCASCGKGLSPIGEEHSEQFEIIPAIMRVIENIRLKYCCKSCESNVKTAPMPAQIIPKSIATPGLLAHILVCKFCDHLPLYRQEKILERLGIDIGRGTLSRWIILCAKQLLPLIKLMQERIINYDIAYADETPVQVLKEPNKRYDQLSYMWLYIGGKAEERCYIYDYQPSRAGIHVQNFLEGFTGYLHADGYKGYECLFNKGVKGSGCWSHARRKFVKIAQCDKEHQGLAYWAVNHIAKLYEIEKQAKIDQLIAEQIRRVREEKAKPLLKEFKTWLVKYADQVLPKSPLGKAIAYALKQWSLLTRYLEDGRLEIDNNRTERSIKPFTIGRKNWLFHDNVAGAKAGSVIFSLIETSKAHGLNVYAYMKYILSEIVYCDTVEKLEKLLPFNCSKEQLELQQFNERQQSLNFIQPPLANTS